MFIYRFKRLNLVFVFNKKAACTTIKHVINHMDDLGHVCQKHHQIHFHVKSNCTLDQIMAMACPIVLFKRHPVDRFISGFGKVESKRILTIKFDKSQSQEQCNALVQQGNLPINHWANVLSNVRPKNLDSYFALQTLHLKPLLKHPQLVMFDIDNLDTLPTFLSKLLGKDMQFKVHPKYDRQRPRLDDATHQVVLSMYKQDLELLRYEDARPSSMPPTKRLKKEEKCMPYLVLNLDRRKDRWRNMQTELSKFINPQETCQRFAAIDTGNRRGCALSYIKIIETYQDHDKIVVFQDDVQFTQNARQKWDEGLKHVPTDWDIIVSGIASAEHPQKINEHVVKVGAFGCLQLAMFRPKNVLPIAKKYIDDNLCPTLCGKPPAITPGFDKLLGKHLNVYVILPFVSVQKPDMSDLMHAHQNYQRFFDRCEARLKSLS